MLITDFVSHYIYNSCCIKVTELLAVCVFFCLSDVFQRVEMPTQYCLALLELNGIGFSVAECETQKHVMQAKLTDLENKAYQLAGHSFSLTSPEDVAEVCFNPDKPYKNFPWIV